MTGPQAGRKLERLLIVPFLVMLAFAAAGTPSYAASGKSYTPPVPEDFSTLSWTQAFYRLHAKMSREYAFTAWKHIDWRALYAKYGPRIATAEAANDKAAYYRGLRGYVHELRDGHVGIKAADLAAQQKMTEVEWKIAGGGFGLIATRLDDDGVIVSWVKPGGPAARAEIKLGASLLTWGGAPVAKALARTSTVLGPSQPTFARTRYEQTRFLVRAPVGATREVSFRNRGEGVHTVRLRAIDDGLETLTLTDASSILNFGWPERMVEHRILSGNVGYVRIYAEIDLPDPLPGDHTPTLELFRAAINEFIDANVAGVVVDVRANSGGSDRMAADFLGSFYDRRTFYEYQNYIVPATGAFEIWIADDDAPGGYRSPREGIFIEPAARRYAGPVVALVNNGCISSGEGVAMGIKNLPNGKVVGFVGTNGSFGMSGDVALMPGGYLIEWPFGQSLDERKVVQIDTRAGRGGVRPDARVPMNRANALRSAHGEDPVLEYGLRELGRMRRGL